MTTAAKQGTGKGGRKGGRAERGIGEWDPKPGAKLVFFFQLHAGGGGRDGIRWMDAQQIETDYSCSREEGENHDDEDF